MNSLRKFFLTNSRKLLKNTVATFLAGAMLSAAFNVALDNIAQRYLGIALIILSLFILYVFFTLGEIGKKTEIQIDKLGVSAVWLSGTKESFKYSTSLIYSAQKRIMVVSQYASRNRSLKMPTERPEYLQAIEETIRKRVNDRSGKEIVYKRILQSENCEDMKNTHILTKGILNEQPSQTYEHCKRLFDILREEPNSNVDINFFLTEPIASFPTMLLIDGIYALIAFVPLYHKFGETEQTQEMVGAIYIEDRNGQLLADLERTFDKITQSSYQVLRVG